MKLNRVIVFGASGFLGRYAVKRLGQRGAQIAAVGRRASRAVHLRPMGDVGQIALIDARIEDERAVAALVEGADAVVNLVGILYERRRGQFDAVHHEAAGRIARLARAAGVRRLVHISALGADPQSDALYARSKAAGEAAVRAAFPEAVILRPSVVIGPEDQFFNRFAGMARWSPVLPLIGGGATRFQPIYVGDIADAILAAIERADATGRTFDLGGPRVYSFRELMTIMLAQIGRRRRLVSLPFGLAEVLGAAVGWLPAPLLTRDQVRLLRRDAVADPALPGLLDLGVTPTALELILPTYLDRYRRGGRFSTQRFA